MSKSLRQEVETLKSAIVALWDTLYLELRILWYRIFRRDVKIRKFGNIVMFIPKPVKVGEATYEDENGDDVPFHPAYHLIVPPHLADAARKALDENWAWADGSEDESE